MNNNRLVQWEIVRMALRALGTNKLRSALTTSGISIGIFSVISVMTTITALQQSIETGLTFLGANIFQFSKWPMQITSQSDPRLKNRRRIDYQTYLTFVRLVSGHVTLTCPKVWDLGVQAVRGNRKTNPNLEICGTNEGFLAANQFTIALGRNLSAEDVEFSRSVCVIGQDVVDRLFPQENPVGKTLRLDERDYEIVGAFDPKGEAFGGNEDNLIIIPLTRFFENYGSTERSVNIAVQAPSAEVFERTKAFAIGALRKARGLNPEDANDFEIYSNDSLSSAFHNMAGVVSIGAFVISFVSLVAAGVGIMNIMLVSVTERTKEIGIRKSLGARKRDIRLQFLLEALFLSLAGAIVGIAVGVAAGDVLAVLLKADVIFPWFWTLVGVAVCSGIGIGFGLYPAQKAASLDPIEALRFE
jgi:putative ABC transport system permease protein